MWFWSLSFDLWFKNMQFPDLTKILSILNFAVPFLWLTAILLYQIKFKSINIKWVKRGVWAVVALFVTWGAYTTIATYNLWKNDPFSKYLLPPYQPVDYFYGYAFSHFWRPNIASLASSLIWAGVLFVLYKYSKGRILDKADVVLGLFTVLAAGWPGFIIYLAVFFGLLLARQIINIAVFKKNDSIPITQELIISAIIVMIAGNYLVSRFGLDVLRF